jgi:hypothetical protein
MAKQPRSKITGRFLSKRKEYYRLSRRNFDYKPSPDELDADNDRLAKVAENPATPVVALQALLADSRSPSVLIALANNPKLPSHMYRTLLFDRGSEVAEGVLESEYCPVGLIMEAAQHHPSASVRSTARELIDLEEDYDL